MEEVFPLQQQQQLLQHAEIQVPLVGALFPQKQPPSHFLQLPSLHVQLFSILNLSFSRLVSRSRRSFSRAAFLQ